jgi:mono/diheme cytochrome c family protein
MTKRSHLISGLVLSAWASLAAAQVPQETRQGLVVARRVCSECHNVENRVAPSPNARAPTFRAIANTPGMLDAALYGAVRTPHGGMPVLLPEARDVDNVTAYLRSLRMQE